MNKLFNVNWLKKYGRELMLLAALAICYTFIFLPSVIKKFPDEILYAFRFPIDYWRQVGNAFLGGYLQQDTFYRPLQDCFFPFICQDVFGMDYFYWLIVNLGTSFLGIVFFYVLMRVVSKSRVTAWFGALFMISFYAPAFMLYFPDFSQIGGFELAFYLYSLQNLYIMFCLLVIIGWVKFLDTLREVWRLLALVAFILGLLSCEMTILLPVVLLFITFIYKPDFLFELWRSFVGLFLLRFKLKNQRKIFYGLMPVLIAWWSYFVWRLALDFYWGNYSLIKCVCCFTLNLKLIWFNFLNIIMAAFQAPRVFIDIQGSMKYLETPGMGYQHYPIHYLAMLVLIGIVGVVFILELIRNRNRTILLGICLFLVNAFPFLFWSEIHYVQTLPLLPLFGLAMIFGESMRIMCRVMYKSHHYPAEARKQLASPVFYLVMLPLTTILIYNLCYLRWK